VTERVRRADHLFWLLLALVGVAYEVRAVRGYPNLTLTDATRDAFHTNTRAGRFAFTVCWGAFASWFAHHILREPR
jgi:hypothetical protein